MAFVLFKRISFLKVMKTPLLLYPWSRYFALKASSSLDHEREYYVSSRIPLSPLFPTGDDSGFKDCKIEVIDDETWQVSCFSSEKTGTAHFTGDQVDGGDIRTVKSVPFEKFEPDFDDIDDMRIRRNLFYKIDKNSKEYEEYKFDFHRKKSWKNEKYEKENEENNKKKETLKNKLVSVAENSSKKDRTMKKDEDGKSKEVNNSTRLINKIHKRGDLYVAKKLRNPSFNQLTAPYHEPFCLDIYISKGSVRASIIHRATSNVVVVSHSISKDMKFNLESTKNKNACAAVGEVLAQRALADDIHNVVYTPRRGERLEGKLEIVLRSIVDCGIDVKVKLKQQKLRKRQLLSSTTQRWFTAES